MKIREFIEQKTKSNITNRVIIVDKKYLSFREKEQLVEKVLNDCLLYVDGFFSVDELHKYIVFTLAVIEAYTQLEFDSDFEESIKEYDLLCEHGLLNEVISAFEGEYNLVLNMLNIRIESVLSQNSLEAQVSRFFNSILDKIDSLSGALVKSFDLSKLNLDMNEINKLADLLQSVSKK